MALIFIRNQKTGLRLEQMTSRLEGVWKPKSIFSGTVPPSSQMQARVHAVQECTVLVTYDKPLNGRKCDSGHRQMAAHHN